MIFNRKKHSTPERRQRPAHVWTVDKVRTLGMTTDLPTAASIIGIGRTMAYELAKSDEFPVRLRRLRRRVVVSVPELLQWLGATDTPPPGPAERVAAPMGGAGIPRQR